MYYSSSYYAYQRYGVALVIMMFIAVIASVVLAVVVYRKYARTPEDRNLKLTDSKTWPAFLRFETMLIDKLYRILYLWSALYCACLFVGLALAQIFLGFTSFILGLIMYAIALIVCELLIRVCFESAMLNVVIARNTTDIRNCLIARSDTPSAAQLPPAPPAPYAPVEPVPPAPVAPPAAPTPVAPSVPPVVPDEPELTDPEPAPEPVVDDSFALPLSNTAAVTRKYCTNCGAENSESAVFCYNCGTKLL